MNKKIKNITFSEEYIKEAEFYRGLYLGRIISQSKDLYKVVTQESEILAEISGKIRHNINQLSQYPAVGDYVIMDRQEDIHGNGIIHHILKRKSAFIRKAAGKAHDNQVVATNIDTIFICMSLNNDFNLRRMERYLSIAWDSGAVPVIVLTKSDLCENISEKISEIQLIAIGVKVLVTSSLTGDGYEDILEYIKKGETVAFIGSSGVGKSSLINKVLGKQLIETKEIRSDDKGRHATTTRELYYLPNGGAVIDTPGMREIGLESINISKTFTDIEELAMGCKFHDCRHDKEPGCMVKKAIEEGRVTEERLNSYNKLKKEAKYEGLNSKEIEREKINEMFSEFSGIKNARDFAKSKNKK
ncbi:MAG: ribosome small subunit-dependent GTPase A [Firmicutes bacterium]|nr:ribosome small subunit-dependent GTPase A [Bacillota bacterium]